MLFTPFIKTLTFTKALVWYNSLVAYVLARYLKRDVLLRNKPYVTVEVTSKCNLACPECVTGSGELKRPSAHMSLGVFKTIVDKIYRTTMVLNLYMQGEPFLNPELSQMITYARSKGLFISLSTNAQIMPTLKSDTLPHHLIVSVDGATQESYAAYRKGGQLSKVQDFVESIAHWKKENKKSYPFVELQFLVNRINEGEEGQVKQLFKGRYNRFVKKSIQIIHPENKGHFMPLKDKKNRYIAKRKIKRACYKVWSTHVITQAGEMVLCCMDKDAEYACGSLLSQELKSLINNKVARGHRSQLINYKKGIGICANCDFR